MVSREGAAPALRKIALARADGWPFV